MDTATLISRIEQQGVRLWVENGHIRYTAPHGVMTPERKGWLRQHRAALLKALAPTRQDLLAIHPDTIQGYPLATILDHADDSDLPDLRDRETLESFALSLAEHGYLGRKSVRGT
jgi:hypothetical protein